MSRRVANLLLLGLSCLLSVVLVEAGFRVLNGVSVLDRSNWRLQTGVRVNMADGTRYDEVLGWTMKPHLRYDPKVNPMAVNTVEYGVRRNGPHQTGIRRGHVLAVGSSFTAGSEVSDSQTWPAQLESMLGRPVDNAAVGAYGMDQIVLRAEQLLDVWRPQVLLLEAMDGSVLWTSYSHFAKPKPYFTLKQGELVAHHSPVPIVERGDSFEPIKAILGHSLAFDRFMATVAADFWLSTPQATIRRIQNDPVDITCALLQRLKKRTDESGIRALLLIEAGGQELVNGRPPGSVALVAECAEAMGYQVVNIFDALGAAYRTDKSMVEKLYTKHGTAYGHMSKFGNHEVARAIASALAQPVQAASASAYKLSASIAGDGQNLLPYSEALERVFASSPVAQLRPASQELSRWRHFRLVPAGMRGEHYVSTAPIDVEQGPYVISLEVQPQNTAGMRVQLLDGQPNGVLCDVDFLRKTTKTERVGIARQLRAGIEELEGGWYRIWASAMIPGERMTLILQLTDKNGALVFSPGKEVLTVRAVQLERGQSPSPYQTAAPTKFHKGP